MHLRQIKAFVYALVMTACFQPLKTYATSKVIELQLNVNKPEELQDSIKLEDNFYHVSFIAIEFAKKPKKVKRLHFSLSKSDCSGVFYCQSTQPIEITEITQSGEMSTRTSHVSIRFVELITKATQKKVYHLTVSIQNLKCKFRDRTKFYPESEVIIKKKKEEPTASAVIIVVESVPQE